MRDVEIKLAISRRSAIAQRASVLRILRILMRLIKQNENRHYLYTYERKSARTFILLKDGKADGDSAWYWPAFC